jgi:hypothetical protein
LVSAVIWLFCCGLHINFNSNNLTLNEAKKKALIF